MTSGSSYPPKNDFKEGSKEAEVPGSAGFIKNLRLALDGNLASLNDTSNTARAATPSGMHAFLNVVLIILLSLLMYYCFDDYRYNIIKAEI